MMNDALPATVDNVDTLLKFFQGLLCIIKPLPSGQTANSFVVL